jgi:hypothetical protein
MKTTVTALLLLITFTLNTGCEKDDNNPPSGKTVTERLTQQTWIFQEAGLDGDKNGTVDQQDPYLQACRKDNLVTFNSNGTGVNDEGATLCNAGDPQTVPFVWTLSNGDKNLTVDNTTVTIHEITDNTMKVYFDTLVLGTTYRYLTISKH